MAKKTVSPSQNWGAILYFKHSNIVKGLDFDSFASDFIFNSNLGQVCAFQHLHHFHFSPLHRPDISHSEREALKQAVVDKFSKKIVTAQKNCDFARVDKLETDLEAELAEIETKELKIHLHLLIRSKERIRESSAKSLIEEVVGYAEDYFSEFLPSSRIRFSLASRLERINSYRSAYLYLTHRQCPEKQQFEREAYTFPFLGFDPPRIDSKNKELNMIHLKELEKLAYSGRFRSYAHLYRYVTEQYQPGKFAYAENAIFMRSHRAHLDSLCQNFFDKQKEYTF